jgi:Zn-dependent M16 (insulinase) family peptidase
MRLKLLLVAILPISAIAFAAAPLGTFSDVTPQTAARGFRATAVYLNDAGQPFGARFIHQKTGFTLDLIQIQSVPQAFTWTNTFPVSDKGEPHTQEHLLVGKGNKGRALAASESMTLTESSAFTMQRQTCYDFNTKAGLDVFYDEFRLQLDALLHPDYTDEEIRREVRNFGVSENPASHQLRLEEKGTVYNEMISSMNQPAWPLFRQINIDTYGAHHPLAYNSGGEPSGIRQLQPADIRAFHAAHYFLGNMGSIVSLPKGETLDTELGHFDVILNAVQPAPVNLKPEKESGLPRPQPGPAGSIQVVDFPYENDQQPSYVALAWPADRKLSERDALLLDVFLDSFAGDASTDLYRLFINSATRRMDIGADSVFTDFSEDEGFPVDIGFDHVAAANLNEAKVKEIRTLVTSELERIAAWPDGSPELAAFNALVRGRLVETRRQLSKLVNSPPGFGARGTYATWMEQLNHLNREPGFRKSVTQMPDIEAIGAMLDARTNIWRDLLPRWHLTGVTPWGIAARPSPALLKTNQQESLARADAEARVLEARYNVPDEQKAIARYQTDYDAESARLDGLSRATTGRFLSAPPLTLDDQLEYKETKLPSGIPLVSSFFDNMSSATTAVDLRLDAVPEADLPLVSLLPALLTGAGVIDNGKPIPYDQMEELLRKEVLGLNAYFSTDIRSNRVELQVEGAGNDLAESRRAIEWMGLVLLHPDWRPENLPRLRDLVAQAVSRLRATSQGPEESWVMNPVLAYWKQSNPLYLTTSSFLTRAYNADRLRWMLADAGTAEQRAALVEFLTTLSGAASTRSREDLKQMLAAVSGPGPLARDIAQDLTQLLSDVPDATLKTDWKAICDQMRADILVTPEQTLSRLNSLRESLLTSGGARAWNVGSRANLDQLDASLAALTADLRSGSTARTAYSTARLVDERLRAHQADSAVPHFVGLYDPNLTGGVMSTMVPGTSYDDVSRDAQLDYLASNLFSGYGAHGVFTKTITAGLAYSNGIRGNLRDGYTGYYAERMPEIPQTLHFAIDVVKKGPRDPQLLEYVIALAFQESNASRGYEARAQAIADALADGITPEKVKRFREGILAIRKEPDAAQEVMSRVDAAYGRILPGYSPKAKNVPGAVYFIIGNDKQFSALDADVSAREDEHVYRLYPRDFWMVP